jgi:hypothetical protein
LGKSDDKYAIQVKFSAEITSHDGYCSSPDNDSRVETIKEKVFFPAPSSVVDLEMDLDDLMSGFRCADYSGVRLCHCGGGRAEYTFISAKLVHKMPDMYLENFGGLYTSDSD